MLAIPRGGVIVGEVVARELGAPLDVVVPRKIGAPGNPELAIGAVAPGIRVLDPRMVGALRVSRAIPRARDRRLRRPRSTVASAPTGADARRQPVEGRVAIVVDDGVATGEHGRRRAPVGPGAGSAARVVLAVPVAPPQSLERLRAEADEVVVLETPRAVPRGRRVVPATSTRRPTNEVVAALARSAGTRA